MKSMGEFLARVNFNAELRGNIGVEREYFLVDHNGMPFPGSAEFLRKIDNPAWTYELSACQVEHRTQPHAVLETLRNELNEAQEDGSRVAREMGCTLEALEVAREDMLLDVYADDARYVALSQQLPQEVLSAACRVAGVHIHVGVASWEEAIALNNVFTSHLPHLLAMGDRSAGARLALYKMMAPAWRPAVYENVEHFYQVAVEQGFADNLRNCWNMIRISRHGTVEVRTFGMTGDTEEIMRWARYLVALAK